MSVSARFRKSAPKSGTSASSGTLLIVSLTSRRVRPPTTTAWLSGTVTALATVSVWRGGGMPWPPWPVKLFSVIE